MPAGLMTSASTASSSRTVVCDIRTFCEIVEADTGELGAWLKPRLTARILQALAVDPSHRPTLRALVGRARHPCSTTQNGCLGQPAWLVFLLRQILAKMGKPANDQHYPK